MRKGILMKKIVLFLSVAVLLFTVSSAYAYDFSNYSLDELLTIQKEVGHAIYDARATAAQSTSPISQVDGEILFRNIPWGSSYATVKELLPGLSSGYSSIYPEPVYHWAGGSESYKYENEHLTNDCSIYSTLQVAGYDATASLLFAYTVTSPIKMENENSILIGAKYNITNLADPDGVANDLVQKLTSVYGEVSSTSTGSTLGGYSLYYYYWFGANDTFIILKEMNGGQAKNNDVTISYGWRGSNEYIEAFDIAISAEKALEESQHFNNGVTDGL